MAPRLGSGEAQKQFGPRSILGYKKSEPRPESSRESELLELVGARDSFSERDRSEPQIRFRGDREGREGERETPPLSLSSWEWVKMSAQTNQRTLRSLPRKSIRVRVARRQLFAANGFLGGVDSN